MNRIFVFILFFLTLFPVSSFCADLPNVPALSAQQLFQERAGRLQWKNLSIEFRPVVDKPAKGFQSMVVKSGYAENGKTYYVGKKSILSLREMKNIDVSYDPSDFDMLRLMINFNDAGKKILKDYSTEHINEMMGVVIDGQLRLVAHLRQPLVNGRVQVSGFNPNEAVGIARRYYEPRLELARKISAELATPNKK